MLVLVFVTRTTVLLTLALFTVMGAYANFRSMQIGDPNLYGFHLQMGVIFSFLCILCLAGIGLFGFLHLRRRHKVAIGLVMVGAVIAVSAIASPSARAEQPPPLHDKTWYMQHGAERSATLGWCHLSAERSRLYDCQNAEAAGGTPLLTRRTHDFLTDPEWWRENPIARDGVLRACARRSPDYAPMMPYCRYAAAGSL